MQVAASFQDLVSGTRLFQISRGRAAERGKAWHAKSNHKLATSLRSSLHAASHSMIGLQYQTAHKRCIGCTLLYSLLRLRIPPPLHSLPTSRPWTLLSPCRISKSWSHFPHSSWKIGGHTAHHFSPVELAARSRLRGKGCGRDHDHARFTQKNAIPSLASAVASSNCRSCSLNHLASGGISSKLPRLLTSLSHVCRFAASSSIGRGFEWPVRTTSAVLFGRLS